ncbi:hypothetical protein LOAG_15651 [Loa loa]|uniref:Uncharacterized protein n=1 Tax=Loa loa TaxID=7209 RepID=A0A1S0TG20_LOALO|nr:hypothetical protein LOAG_15651 [Loa loa]EFO12881.1 hypothetical protein LOAG_15651 [Loa loa]
MKNPEEQKMNILHSNNNGVFNNLKNSLEFVQSLKKPVNMRYDIKVYKMHLKSMKNNLYSSEWYYFFTIFVPVYLKRRIMWFNRSRTAKPDCCPKRSSDPPHRTFDQQ